MLILAGVVRVDGDPIRRSADSVAEDATISIDVGPRFVSRGGEKLVAALDELRLDVAGRVCLDLGSSTGGFTDCLLQRGAVRVYAVDVGKGQLEWKLRNDARVVVMEGLNAREGVALPETVGLIVADVCPERVVSCAEVGPAMVNQPSSRAASTLYMRISLERGECAANDSVVGMEYDTRRHRA